MKLTRDFILGICQEKACFTYSRVRSGKLKIEKIPVFSIEMGQLNLELLEGVKDGMGLSSSIHTYARRTTKINGSVGRCVLLVRDLGQIKNSVIPFFFGSLFGTKKFQFEEWIKTMASDPEVAERFKILPKIFESGFYSKKVNSV